MMSHFPVYMPASMGKIWSDYLLVQPLDNSLEHAGPPIWVYREDPYGMVHQAAAFQNYGNLNSAVTLRMVREICLLHPSDQDTLIPIDLVLISRAATRLVGKHHPSPVIPFDTLQPQPDPRPPMMVPCCSVEVVIQTPTLKRRSQ